MPKPKREVETGLAVKGFVRRPGDHNFLVYNTLAGVQTSITTKTSHGKRKKDIQDGLLAAMSRQCGLTRKEFLDLLECPMSREEFEEILHSRGIL